MGAESKQLGHLQSECGPETMFVWLYHGLFIFLINSQAVFQLLFLSLPAFCEAYDATMFDLRPLTLIRHSSNRLLTDTTNKLFFLRLRHHYSSNASSQDVHGASRCHGGVLCRRWPEHYY